MNTTNPASSLLTRILRAVRMLLKVALALALFLYVVVAANLGACKFRIQAAILRRKTRRAQERTEALERRLRILAAASPHSL